MKTKSFVLVLTLSCVSLPAFSGEKLSGDQIKEFFSDKTCDIEVMDRNKNKHVTAYTSPDGKRIVYIPWKNKKSKRKWWVEGNRFCASHPKKGDFCRDMVPMGDGVIHAMTDGKHLRTLTNCRDGNQV
ncbi:MAG: hypothetical protein EP297_07390 [Gammaproteobacteria bacterium]|nr:MAG: hypothetical protein EP297_07390 [Gammaproteobacteria bacterium]